MVLWKAAHEGGLSVLFYRCAPKIAKKPVR